MGHKNAFTKVALSFHASSCVHCCGIAKAAPHSVPMMDRTGTSVLTDDSHHSQMKCTRLFTIAWWHMISTQPVSAMGTDQLILRQVCKQQKRGLCFYLPKDICKISNRYFMPVIEGWTMNALTCGRSNKSSYLSAHSLLGKSEPPCQRHSMKSHKRERQRKRETSGWQGSPGPPLEIGQIYVSHAVRMMSLWLSDKSR